MTSKVYKLTFGDEGFFFVFPTLKDALRQVEEFPGLKRVKGKSVYDLKIDEYMIESLDYVYYGA